MAAFKRTLKWDQGGSVDDIFTWKTGETPVPVDLTGCTARMQVREALDEDALLELTTVNGKLVLGGVAGTVQMLLTAADTAALDFIAAYYDLEIIFVSGAVRRLMEGQVILSPNVTR